MDNSGAVSGTGGDISGTAIKAQLFDATGAKVGAELLVNTVTSAAQEEPTVAALADGGFVISWTDNSATGVDASGTAVKAQIFNASGAPLGGEVLVNTTTLANQNQPAITGLANGGFVASWTDYNASDVANIKAQLFDASGNPVGNEVLVNTATSTLQWAPTITALANGGYAISWTDYSVGFGGATGDASGAAIKAQVFNAFGVAVGGEVLVNTQTLNNQTAPTITGLVNGGFVVSWTDYSGKGGDTSGSAIKAQLFNAAGVKLGTEFLVNTSTTGDQRSSSITALANGGFAISWRDESGARGDAGGSSVKAQVFDAAGTKIGSEFLVNSETASDQYAATITGLADGRFAISWTDTSQLRSDTSGSGIKAQIFALEQTPGHAPAITSNGGGITASLTLAENTKAVTTVSASDPDAGTKFSYAIVGGGDAARFVIDANSGALAFKTAPNFESPADVGLDNTYNVTVQVSDGALTATQTRAVVVANVNEAPAITSNGGGSSAALSLAENTTAVTTVAAVDPDAGTTFAYGITGGADAALFTIDSATGALAFKSAPNFEVPADAGANNVYDVVVQVSDGALTANQVLAISVTNVIEAVSLTGTAGNDVLNGSDENDTLIGLDGNDVLSGGLGNDRLDGGAGIDTVSYADATAGVKVSLALTGGQSTGAAGGKDTLVSIENVIGSAFKDTLTGDSGDNGLTGLAGNDKLDGQAGADSMIGGLGNDTYTVDNAGDVVVEAAGEGTDSVNASVSYTLAANVEKLTLTGTADLIGTGNASTNTLTGNAGNNLLLGLAGNDAISGGAGDDTMSGGQGADTLTGGAGADHFRFDVLETASNKDTISDFAHGEDKIEIDHTVFAAFAADPLGELSALELGFGTKAVTASQHLIYNAAKGALYYDDDGNGAHAQVQIALFSTLPVLDAGDFVLV